MLRLLASVAALALVHAQSGRTGNPVPRIVPSHEDVLIAGSLQGDININAVPAGTILKFVAGFVNHSPSPLNITGIMGSLNEPADFSMYRYNFSGLPIGEAVDTDHEISLEYPVQVPVSFPNYPFTLQMALTVFYIDDAGGYYTSTFFNETVTFVEPDTPLIAKDDILSYVLGITTVIVFVMFFPDSIHSFQSTDLANARNNLFSVFFGSSKASGKAGKNTAAVQESAADDDDDYAALFKTNSSKKSAKSPKSKQ